MSGAGFISTLLVLCALLGLMFFNSLLPGHTLFSNDGPLGTQMSVSHRLPGGFRWQDLNSVGFREGGVMPSVTYGLLWLVGPIEYSKLYAPVGLLVLGMGAWCFFRQLGLAPLACLLGALAAVLNMGFFSVACWGLASHAITFGMTFFALAALANTNPRGQWIRVALAGLAVGMAVTEGADIGAIFSLFVAAFAMYQGYIGSGSSSPAANQAGVVPPSDAPDSAAPLRAALRWETIFLWVCLVGLIVALFGGAVLWLSESFLHLKMQIAHALADKLGLFIILVLVAFAVTLWLALVQKKPTAQRLVRGTPRVAVVAAFAVFLAIQAIIGLVAVSIQGVHGLGEDAQSKEQRWDFATQWSLPKKEALGLIIPGLFGYRMDTPQGLPEWAQEHYQGGNYWGAVGSDPAWERYYEAKARGQDVAEPSGAFRRFGGGAPYAGILVELLAVWAAAQALRKKDSAFSEHSRRFVWFWMAVAVVSLPLAFGRFAPFYRLPYFLLPYFSTIRNPTKFLHPLSMALVVLFAYGVHGLWRRYLSSGATAAAAAGAAGVQPGSPVKPKPASAGRESRSGGGSQAPAANRRIGPQPTGLKGWWQTVRGFDRRWTLGSLVALAVSFLGWLLYASNRDGLVNYIAQAGFNDPNNGQATAKAMAAFSVGQVGWFVLFFAVAIGLVVLVISGKFSGPRAKWAGLALGLFLVIDLGLANQPWILTWNYKQKYASDQVLDLLKQKPYEHRVAGLPEWLSAGWVQPQLAGIEQYFRHGVYGVEWTQHQFLYYNIQSLDVVQMPREPEDLLAYRTTLNATRGAHSVQDVVGMSYLEGRRWQLTNTRYLLGAAGWLDFLNQHVDPQHHSFRVVERFSMQPKPGVVGQPSDFSQLAAVPATNGPFALYEFTGALPRAKLYANWQVNTNDTAVLAQLSSPSFDPEKGVLVDTAGSIPPNAGGTNADAGTVQFDSYAPTDLKLKAKASAPTVLLLNDHYEPNWHVLVGGKPAPLLRCNYLMRGVLLGPGEHLVEFRFQPPENMFYVSLAAIILGVAFCGILFAMSRNPGPGPSAPASAPEPSEGTNSRPKEERRNKQELVKAKA